MKRLLSVLALAAGLTLSTAAFAGKRPPPAPPVTGVVNLNTASADQLALLPGVGPKRAKAILAWREKNHFLKVDDVRKVKGVGKGVLAKARTHLAVSGPNTIAKLKGGSAAEPGPVPQL